MIQKTTSNSNQKLRYYLSLDSVNFGSADYGRAIAHELGHYVFWLGDEYMDWHERIYYVPDSIFEGVIPTYLLGGIAYSRTTAGWFYDNRIPPHSIMDMTYEYSELSWPADYERFKANLTKKFGENNWEEHMTDQWAGKIRGENKWKCSAWEAVYSFLSGHNTPQWIRDVFKPENHPRRQRVLISIPSLGNNFIPKTGPYTGVGYFMEVTRR